MVDACGQLGKGATTAAIEVAKQLTTHTSAEVRPLFSDDSANITICARTDIGSIVGPRKPYHPSAWFNPY